MQNTLLAYTPTTLITIINHRIFFSPAALRLFRCYLCSGPNVYIINNSKQRQIRLFTAIRIFNTLSAGWIQRARARCVTHACFSQRTCAGCTRSLAKSPFDFDISSSSVSAHARVPRKSRLGCSSSHWQRARDKGRTAGNAFIILACASHMVIAR